MTNVVYLTEGAVSEMTESKKKLTLPGLFKKKEIGEPISMITCYDYPTAFFEEQAGIDIILVGDSLGMTILGYGTTLPVTMDDMVRHSQAVRRGAPNTWLVVDMPYMSYQPSVETAVRSAGRLMAETECDAVKLEGGAEFADRISAIVTAGIPVMGHLGLTPQSVGALGGYRLQGKTAERACKIVEDAQVLEQAGAYAIVVEVVPQQVCKLIHERARGSIIIGQGSGPYADGQILIFHDMFGLYPRFKPRMAKVYADAAEVITGGLRKYVEEVGAKEYPRPENWFAMSGDELRQLNRLLGKDTDD
jgi:3-methyl-2-oxobutanoate hydroxymethyltransferase